MFSSFHSRKAQGMSLNVIVIAVIVLVILVVLLVIFSGKIKFFSSTVSSCEQKGAGASCMTENEAKSCQGPVYRTGTSCNDANKVCCVPIGG